MADDDYSRAIAGYYFSEFAPSALQTALALKQAIWFKQEAEWQICGIPEQLYTDHGSDFTSQHIEMVCADLKIQLIFSSIGKPRGRGKIERFFSIVNQTFLCQLPGYIAPGNSSKDDSLISFVELERKFINYFLKKYHTTLHSTKNVAPIVKWNENGFLPQLPKSLEQLDLLLLTISQPRKVHQDGLYFQGLRYIDPILSAYVDEKVIIRYDPRDISEIRVFYRNVFLCRAVCQELAAETIELKEIISARNNRKKHLKKIISERKSLVDQLLCNKQNLDSKDENFCLTNKEGPLSEKGIKLYEND